MIVLVNILAIVVLGLSFVGGFKDGVVKSFFSLLALIIAIPLAGVSYHLLAGILSFLPGENWENFLGFFITIALISVILHSIFFLPRKFLHKLWPKGGLLRLIGGGLNIFNAAIGMVVFTLVLLAYPIFNWLEEVVAGSGILTWLVVQLGFVKTMLPEIFQSLPVV
jgi:uncharacterized membrane protein required for colicin V production